MHTYQNARRAALVAILLLWTTACGKAEPTTFDTLGKAPAERDPDVFRIHVGSTANHVAWLSHRGKAYVVALDGVEGRTYDNLKANEKFSPDGERFLYVADRAPDGEFLVVDGKEIACGGVDHPTFSPDSKQIAYAIRTFVAKRRSPQAITLELVIDGPDGTRSFPAGSTEFALSPDGKHFAYCSAPGTLVIDGKPGKPYEVNSGKGLWSIQFSPDGKRVAYAVNPQSGRDFCVCDGVEGEVYHQICGIEFSPDSKKYVYIGERAQPHPAPWQYDLWVDGAKIGTYAGVSLPVFSPDGSRMAYRATTENDRSMSFMVVDGLAGKSYAKTSLPIFSRDGKHVAYMVEHLAYIMADNRNSQRGLVVKDGVEGPIYDRCYDPVFSPDSAHMAYRTTQMKTEAGRTTLFDQIVVDGKEQAVYDHASDPLFSPDSKHIAYCATRDGHAYLVVDGTESDPFDRWFWPGTVFFDSPTHVRCMGVKAGNVVRIARNIP